MKNLVGRETAEPSGLSRLSRRRFHFFRTGACWGCYLPVSGLGGVLGAGFFAGVETPRLIRKNFSPLRMEAMTLMVTIFSDLLPVCPVGSRRRGAYFLSDASAAGAGAGPPRRICNAAGGRGLSALASSRLTCQISLLDSSVL